MALCDGHACDADGKVLRGAKVKKKIEPENGIWLSPNMTALLIKGISG
jgi:hypothetical protein